LKPRSLYEIALEESKDEITDYTVYKKLSNMEKNPKYKTIFSELTNVEYKHYNFWAKYIENKNVGPDLFKVYLVLILRYIFGGAFAIKYLEKHENLAIKKYEFIKRSIPKEDRETFDKIILEEQKHEKEFADQIQGTYVKYISFIVLGLADALVEIGGIHAGSLGIYNSTELTGLAGIIAGAAASIAMASASYAQAKQGFEGSAKLAAMYTGISYFVSAVILAMPYFLTSVMLYAITISLVFGILIIALATWYNSIISGSKFRRDFMELAGIMLLATVVLFGFGLLIRHFLHISI
jgi:vacuolar iron transporter family protein